MRKMYLNLKQGIVTKEDIKNSILCITIFNFCMKNTFHFIFIGYFSFARNGRIAIKAYDIFL